MVSKYLQEHLSEMNCLISMNQASKLVFGNYTTFAQNYDRKEGWQPLQVTEVKGRSYFDITEFKEFLKKEIGNDFLVSRSDVMKASGVNIKPYGNASHLYFLALFEGCRRIGGAKKNYLFLSEVNRVLKGNNYKPLTIYDITALKDRSNEASNN